MTSFPSSPDPREQHLGQTSFLPDIGMGRGSRDEPNLVGNGSDGPLPIPTAHTRREKYPQHAGARFDFDCGDEEGLGPAWRMRRFFPADVVYPIIRVYIVGE